MGYSVDQQTRRLALFCESYGMDRQMRSDLLPMIKNRLESEISNFAKRCRVTLQTHWQEWRQAVIS